MEINCFIFFDKFEYIMNPKLLECVKILAALLIVAFLYAQCIKSVTIAKRKDGYIRQTIVQDIDNILGAMSSCSDQDKICVQGGYGFDGYEIEISGNANENIIHKIVSYCINYNRKYEDIHSFRVSFHAYIDGDEYLALEVNK